MTPYIIMLLFGLLLLYVISPLHIIDPANLLTDGENNYLFVRWNWYVVNGMAAHNNDAYFIRVKAWGIFAVAQSGEFGDNSDRYKLVKCGKGIRPY